MFGLCMPTGNTYLILKDEKQESIMLNDEVNPRKFIMTDKHVLSAVKRHGYVSVEAIVYERYGKKTTVSMAEYYAEHGQELEA